jgi:hypothetical protein
VEDEFVAYCGLYCENCLVRARIGPTARELKEQMLAQGFDQFGPSMENFDEFWKFLDSLTATEGCPGCRKGGSETCVTRNCAIKKRVDSCPLCEEYPCSLFDWSRAYYHYPTLEADNLLMKGKGLAAWIEMQKERREHGFNYAQDRENRRAGEL